jgi:hypothetical protein
MERVPKLSSSEEFVHMTEWERYFWLSCAYIEASHTLCESMLVGHFTAQYSSSRVILHVMQQGIELFLKGAICRAKGARPAQTHDLETLLAEYRREYPGPLFYFQIPTRFQMGSNLDLFPEISLDERATLDQRHRYPSDRQGRSFAAPEIFDPSQVFEEIDTLDGMLKALEWGRIRLLPVR